ncbi:hypothetical protein VP01_2701g2 [Puccinia sorghi]|uniref:Uncharacterized protein n=1 Tax=Puccinia sorghi TaxID=27349 RepID=A0A0L6V5G0_9BASI|nr:hypothetical protein VP01_2701g2 [Puccinia sorghi]
MSRLPSYPPHMSTCPLGPDLHRSQHPLTQTEKLFNSFQRLDGFTGTVLPSGSTRFPSSTPLTNTSILIGNKLLPPSLGLAHPPRLMRSV